MKKSFQNGSALVIICTLVFVLVLALSQNIDESPLPLEVTRVLGVVIILLSIAGFVIGLRKYIASRHPKTSVSFPHTAADEKQEIPTDVKGGISQDPAADQKPEETGDGGNPAPAPEKPSEEKKPEKKTGKVKYPKKMLNDVSFIKDMHHTTSGAWQQYDFLLAARGYGWAYMVNSADYMADADLENIGTVTVSELSGMPEKELVDRYNACGKKIQNIPELADEKGTLAIGGMSRTLGFQPLKIVWFNQTKIIRIFGIDDDEEIFRRYGETMIRRTFGSSDAMKLAKPVPVDEKH